MKISKTYVSIIRLLCACKIISLNGAANSQRAHGNRKWQACAGISREPVPTAPSERLTPLWCSPAHARDTEVC